MDSAEWDARYTATSDLMWTAQPNRFVVDVLALLTPGRALDLAAGEGRNAVWLAAEGCASTGPRRPAGG
jgi:ubiquinone/menaquinone biosynthesis C-methylase UbiE